VTKGAAQGNDIVSWSAVANATSYDVYKATSAGGTYSVVAPAVATLSWTDVTAAEDVNNYYKVVSNGCAASGFSNMDWGYAQGCVKRTATIYADWKTFGSPACWCYPRNCRGDADGGKQGNTTQGYTYVYTNDLNILTAAWNVREPTKGAGIMSIPNGICADFGRDKQGNSTQGYTRVYTNDLNILTTYWNVREPTKGAGVPVCGTYNSADPTYNFSK
jgi:hypothetical protein